MVLPPKDQARDHVCPALSVNHVSIVIELLVERDADRELRVVTASARQRQNPTPRLVPPKSVIIGAKQRESVAVKAAATGLIKRPFVLKGLRRKQARHGKQRQGKSNNKFGCGRRPIHVATRMHL